MDFLQKRPERKGLLMITAGILPLFLCLICTFINARQIVNRQHAATSEMLMAHAEAISDLAWDMIDQLRRFPGKKCDEINSELQQYAALYPYFRSLGVIQDGRVTCSSAFGSIQSDVPTLIQRQPPTPRNAGWMLSLAGTYGVTDRSAVIFMRETPGQFSAFALVDGQYLLDFMNAVSRSQGNSIAIRFGDGFTIGSSVTDPTKHSLLHAITQHKTSDRYPITVSISSPASNTVHNWRQSLFTFVPMAIIFSLLLMSVTNNWLQRGLSMRDKLQKAMLRHEFSVNYQPVYHIATARVSGAEVLMRWQLPDGSWMRPDLFISAAEAEGMMIPLTRHLMQMIIKDAENWSLPPGFRLAINVAADHVQHEDFVIDIRQFMAGMAMHRPNITLELTERSLLSDGEEVVQKLQQLRNEGIHIAIDDFGTGHCSLSYLQTFPLDYLKIDRGFVNAIEDAAGETPVLDAIIMLSHKLKLMSVAEGVETPEQLQYLRDRGVVFIQGYLYAHPMNSRALMAWLQENGQRPLEF